MKRAAPLTQKGSALLHVLLLLVVLLGVGGCGWYVAYHRAQLKESNAPVANDPSDMPTPVSQTVQGVKLTDIAYYKLAIGTTAYYGHARAVSDRYVQLAPVYYMGATGTLTAQGNELSGPEPIMYVVKNQIATFTQLTVTDSVVKAIGTYEKDNPGFAVDDASRGSNIDDYKETNKFQSVTFDDGKTYYGKVKSLSGDQVFSSGTPVYTLQSSGQVSLVAVDATTAGALRNEHVVFWQNLKSDGKVSKAISTYLQQNSSPTYD